MEPSPIVGRDRELTLFDDLLDRKRSGVVLLSARAGLGKSRLLQEVVGRAREGGWAATAPDGESDLSVNALTTMKTLGERLRDVLDLPDPEDLRIEASADSIQRAPSLLDQIREKAPALIIVDGYRPSREFRRSFERQFLPRLSALSAPVLLVLAELPEPIRALAKRIDPLKHIELGPLSEEDVHSYLNEIAHGLEPPLGEDELTIYTRRACSEPEVLVGITALFDLIREPASAT